MNYTVIWRDGGDFYTVTVVDTDKDPAQISSLDWVLMAAEVEYALWDESDKNDALDYIENHSYDFIGVLKGEPEWVA